jgi:hypothetical protein
MDFCGAAVTTFSTPLGVHFLRSLANCLNVHVLTNTVRLRDERRKHLLNQLSMKERKTQKAIEMHTMSLESLLDKFLAKRQLVRVVRPKTNLITPYDEENPVILTEEDLKCLKQPTPMKTQQEKQQKQKGKGKIDTLAAQSSQETDTAMSPQKSQLNSPNAPPPSAPVKTREERVTKTPLVKTPSGFTAHKDRRQEEEPKGKTPMKREEPRGRTPMKRDFRSRSRDREPSRKQFC